MNDNGLEEELSEKLKDSTEEEIKKKISEFGGLLTREAAVRLLCRQNGIEVDRPVALAKAKGTSLPFSFRAKVGRIFPVQEHFGGNTKTVRLHVSDGSADATLLLWNEQTLFVGPDGIGAGDEIEVKGAYFRSGEICVSRGSRITRIGKRAITTLADLSDGECNVEGEVRKISPGCIDANVVQNGGIPLFSFEICDGERCRQVFVWRQGNFAMPEEKDRVRLEGVVFKKGEIHFNSHSRMVRISSKARFRGKIKEAKVSSEYAFFVIDEKEYRMPCEEALRLLGVSTIPPGVEPSVLFSIRSEGLAGKEISYGKKDGQLLWIEE